MDRGELEKLVDAEGGAWLGPVPSDDRTSVEPAVAAVLHAAVRGLGLVLDGGAVDVHVAGLRQKLEANPKSPELIVTIHGFGYKFTG